MGTSEYSSVNSHVSEVSRKETSENDGGVDGGQSERSVAVCLILSGWTDRRVRGAPSFHLLPSLTLSTTDILASRACGSNIYSHSGR